MEIADSIYKGVVEPSYKKTTWEDATCAGHSRLMRVKFDPSNTYSEMSEGSENCRKIYVDYPKRKSKPTCLIHEPGHSSYECKILGDFGSKYVKSRPTKDRGHNLVPIKIFIR